MDICNEITKAKTAAAEMAYKYSVAATYGNANENMYYKLLQINAMIKVLQNNSSLTGNNNLSLDSGCSCNSTDYSRCLSDYEICNLAQNLQVLGNYTDC